MKKLITVIVVVSVVLSACGVRNKDKCTCVQQEIEVKEVFETLEETLAKPLIETTMATVEETTMAEPMETVTEIAQLTMSKRNDNRPYQVVLKMTNEDYEEDEGDKIEFEIRYYIEEKKVSYVSAKGSEFKSMYMNLDNLKRQEGYDFGLVNERGNLVYPILTVENNEVTFFLYELQNRPEPYGVLKHVWVEHLGYPICKEGKVYIASNSKQLEYESPKFGKILLVFPKELNEVEIVQRQIKPEELEWTISPRVDPENAILEAKQEELHFSEVIKQKEVDGIRTMIASKEFQEYIVPEEQIKGEAHYVTDWETAKVIVEKIK